MCQIILCPFEANNTFRATQKHNARRGFARACKNLLRTLPVTPSEPATPSTPSTGGNTGGSSGGGNKGNSGGNNGDNSVGNSGSKKRRQQARLHKRTDC
ncbi:MAG: hypothetical protein L6V93_03945 [Clostridiales bacterium]|nr:MAG: hypothetical protein L6V93_03945 [Clostridiales bacterium]